MSAQANGSQPDKLATAVYSYGCHQWGACGKSPQVNAV